MLILLAEAMKEAEVVVESLQEHSSISLRQGPSSKNLHTAVDGTVDGGDEGEGSGGMQPLKNLPGKPLRQEHQPGTRKRSGLLVLERKGRVEGKGKGGKGGVRKELEREGWKGGREGWKRRVERENGSGKGKDGRRKGRKRVNWKRRREGIERE